MAALEMPGTPEAGSPAWRLRQQKFRKVVVDDRTQIDVCLQHGEDCVRISGIRGFTVSGNVRVGQFLIGAALGSARVSFVSLSQPLVEKELMRLKSIKKPFSLLIADELDHHRDTNPETERTLSPEKSYRRRVFAGATNSTPDRELNPQEFTPQRNGKSPDVTVDAREKVESEDGEHHHDVDAVSVILRDHDVAKIQASLEKLRSDRLAVERMKSESVKKDAKIIQLVKENEKLRSQLATHKMQIDSQKRLFSELELSKEKVTMLETRLEQKERELNEIRERSVATEEFLQTSLDQEKMARQEEKEESERNLEIMREELRRAEEDSRAGTLRVNELREEMQMLSHLFHEEKNAMQDLRAREDDRYASVQRSMEALQVERDELLLKTQRLELKEEDHLNTERNLRNALNTAEERANLLVGTTKELEENNVMLRKQLLEAERKHSDIVDNISMRLKDSDHRVVHLQRDLDDTKNKIHHLESTRNGTSSEYNQLKTELLRKEQELQATKEALHRLTTQRKSMETQLSQASKKLETVHNRMLTEMSRSASLAKKLEIERRSCRDWAKQRLDLLEQFCEEEQRFRKLASDI